MVVLGGFEPWSELPRCNEKKGMDINTMTTSAASERIRGRRATKSAHRCQLVATTTGSGPWAWSARLSLRLRAWCFWKPSRAGRSVRDANIVISTVSEEAMATPLRNESRRTSMPSSAIHTVMPAKSTARPEVLTAVIIESSTLIPRFRPWRLRVTMKSA